jgi:hypothetical protein
VLFSFVVYAGHEAKGWDGLGIILLTFFCCGITSSIGLLWAIGDLIYATDRPALPRWPASIAILVHCAFLMPLLCFLTYR